jgi:hypothetical protein
LRCTAPSLTSPPRASRAFAFLSRPALTPTLDRAPLLTTFSLSLRLFLRLPVPGGLQRFEGIDFNNNLIRSTSMSCIIWINKSQKNCMKARLTNIIPFPSNSALVVFSFDTGTVWQERAPPVIQTIIVTNTSNLNKNECRIMILPSLRNKTGVIFTSSHSRLRWRINSDGRTLQCIQSSAATGSCAAANRDTFSANYSCRDCCIHDCCLRKGRQLTNFYIDRRRSAERIAVRRRKEERNHILPMN